MVDSVGADGQASSNSWNPSLVVGISVGGACLVLLLVGLLGLCLYKLGKRRGYSVVPYQGTPGSDCGQVEILISGCGGPSETNRSIHVEAGKMVISIQDLKIATNNFSDDNILGRGGFGTVYKGELHDGTKVAVKRTESGGFDEFESEIAVLTKVRHRHLVALLGYCLDGSERLLVYEYMPQGTLTRFLFDWEREHLRPLEWTQRLMIALDVARGVEYLHCFAQQSFIHRDLKPCNILLGDDMRAKVADFGFVRLAPRGECSYVPKVAGTFGYFAPEYAGMGKVTTKIDVFSFGVILMELITGRKAVDKTLGEGLHLMQWLRRHMDDDHVSPEAIDPTLDLDREALDGVTTVATLAYQCCASKPQSRPDMSHVVNVLSSLSEPWNPSDPNTEDSHKIDVDEEELVHLFGLRPSEHDPHDDSDADYSEIVVWKPSEHYPHDDSDCYGSHKTEINEQPLACVLELSRLKPSEHDPHDNYDTDYSEIVGWKPSEHYPHEDSDTDDDSRKTEVNKEPLPCVVELSSLKPSEQDPHDGFDTAYSEIISWKPSEHYPLDESDSDDDSYEIDFSEKAPVNVVELASHGCAFEPHQSHAFDVFSPLGKSSEPKLEHELELEPGDESYESDLDEEAPSHPAELATLGCASKPQKSHAVNVFSPLAKPWKPSDEIDLDEEALAIVVELFGWKPSEHDPDDDSDSDYSEIVGWKPSEHYPHDDSYETDFDQESLASVMELAIHSHASEPHQNPGKIHALEAV